MINVYKIFKILLHEMMVKFFRLACIISLLYLVLSLHANANNLDDLINTLENKNYNITMEFIEHNEGYHHKHLTSYKNKHDVWTICSGLTFYLTDHKMIGRKCKLLDPNKTDKGYVCPVVQGDTLDNDWCYIYQTRTFRYFDSKLKQIMSKTYDKLYNNQFFYKVAMDILWCYGESGKQVKKVFQRLKDLAESNFISKKKIYAFYEAVRKLNKHKHKIFRKGITQRLSRYDDFLILYQEAHTKRYDVSIQNIFVYT